MKISTLAVFSSLLLTGLLGTLSQSSSAWAAKEAPVRSFQMTAVEIGGTKFWFPSTLIVKKGDLVKIHAVSKVPGDSNAKLHGLAFDDFNAQALVDEKGKDLEFVADKAGTFPIRCHLHPAHQGGQLLVLE